MPPDVLETVHAGSWTGPFDQGIRGQAIAALESGRVIVLPELAFALLPAELALLTPTALDNSRKSISRDPHTGLTHGTAAQGPELAALSALLARYGEQSAALVRGLFPAYAAGLEQARTSFRPAEISGRATSLRHDDRRLHVDAFPTRPMRGRRILRVFTNVAPEGTLRQWRVGEDFADFAARFVARVRAPLPGQFWVMDRLGLTKGRRSAYDHLMLGLHDAAKLDSGWQDSTPAAAVAFAPGTTWLCFTDCVLHAAMSGRCALEQTFHLPVEAMAEPAKSPLRVLERLTGRALA